MGYTNEVLLEMENERQFNALNSKEALEEAIKGLEAAAAKFSKDCIRDNDLRQAYNKNIKEYVAEIRKQVANKKVNLYNASRLCNQQRNRLMAETRAASSHQARAYAELKKRDGKKFIELANKYSRRIFNKNYDMLSIRDKSKVHYTILAAAARPNPNVNLESKYLRIAGKVLVVVTVALAAYHIYKSDDKFREAAKQAGIVGGGVLGGSVGAGVGGFICGPGAPICITAFALVGAIVGGIFGGYAMEEIHDEFLEFEKWGIS